MIKIRQERKQDHQRVLEIVRQAFWNLYQPGANEHFLLSKLRKSKDYIKQLALIAEIGDKVVGQITYSISYIKDKEQNKHQTITFGPVSVLPDFQAKGVGYKLIDQSIKRAKQLGFKAIIIYGYPSYYKRFGFINGKQYQISIEGGIFPKSLQVLELQKQWLKNVNGTFYESEVFSKLDEKDCEEFDKQFKYKEKYETFSQKVFQKMRNLSVNDPDPQNIYNLNNKNPIK